MSYTTVHQCANEEAFLNRVAAAISQEAWQNTSFSGTQTASMAKQSPTSVVGWFTWPIALANQAAYEYAVNAGNPNPGGDPAVITDADILSGVQTFWPDKPPEPPPAPPLEPAVLPTEP